MKRILFVDDEINVLDSLRNVLRRQRSVWEMVFAVGGHAALEEMARQPFDVVVSDMRMPGMDGAALLEVVRETYPRTARLVLSGHAERDTVLRALPVVHQYLGKPCDVDELKEVIERTCALQTALHDDAIRALVSRIDTLPVAPRSYQEITKLAARANTGLAEIGAIVEQDPALVAKILQLVNSAYFGLAQRITCISVAVQYLGLELIKSLALAEHVFSIGGRGFPGFSIEEVRAHSMMTALAAKALVLDARLREDAFTAGILHDVGKIVLALGRPSQYEETSRQARETGRPFRELEKEFLGATHAEAGAFLLGMWGLPLTIVEAVAFHHRPSQVPAGDRTILAAVHLADILVDAVQAKRTEDDVVAQLDLEFLAAAGFERDVPRWLGVAAKVVHERTEGEAG